VWSDHHTTRAKNPDPPQLPSFPTKKPKAVRRFIKRNRLRSLVSIAPLSRHLGPSSAATDTSLFLRKDSEQRALSRRSQRNERLSSVPLPKEPGRDRSSPSPIPSWTL